MDWRFQLSGMGTGGGTTRGLEATPIVADGVIYTTGAWSMVFAFDAKAGQYKKILSPKQVAAIRAYIIARAQEAAKPTQAAHPR